MIYTLGGLLWSAVVIDEIEVVLNYVQEHIHVNGHFLKPTTTKKGLII